jgi:Holliday junction resolvase
MNSREKGKRGERQWRDELRAQGYAARRGQQFSGSPDSPDVVCEDLGWIHFEVKAVERLNIEDAMEQARRDARTQNAERRMENGGEGKVPVVAHRRSFRAWLVTMEAETFFKFLRGDFTEGNEANEGENCRSGADLTEESGESRGNGGNEGRNLDKDNNKGTHR